MKRFIYCILDTETVGGAVIVDGIYHLAGRIIDRYGNILATFNYLIAENFAKINEAYYGKKNFYKYAEMLRDGSITVVATEAEAIAMVDSLCDFYNVRYMMAYNSSFDFIKTACASLIEDREFIDIYLMALQTITHLKKYTKFCRENNLRSNKGRGDKVATSAEAVYAYLTNNPSYEEEHTALEDTKIEMDIFLACLAMHKKFTKNMHQHDCKVNKVFPSWAE